MSRYIYESPDNGKTIYRFDADNPNVDRELYRSPGGLYHSPPDFDIAITIEDDGTVNIKV